jgi:hypothetical protein
MCYYVYLVIIPYYYSYFMSICYQLLAYVLFVEGISSGE